MSNFRQQIAKAIDAAITDHINNPFSDKLLAHRCADAVIVALAFPKIEVTDAMVERADDAYWEYRGRLDSGAKHNPMRAALTAALNGGDE